ncbi:MAG TPA: DNA-directed RNA polymerase subunit omega [Clostridia bacterium]|jgi:DNA-directed RNA polymerase subunit omega|nr:DNA-directed RNA polymerase subunit omega [Clostridia bacterium]
MNQPPLEDMIAKTGSKYLLVVLAAKRARQITEAGTTFSGDKSVKPVTLAFYEIQQGKLTV